MFKTSVELNAAKEEIKVLRKELESAKSGEDYYKRSERDTIFKMECERKTNLLDIEIAKNELRKEMGKALIKSDIDREVAVAKLDIYQKLDNKDQVSKMGTWIEKLIDTAGKKDTINLNVPK